MKRRIGPSEAVLGLLMSFMLLVAISGPVQAANNETCVSNDAELSAALTSGDYYPPLTVKIVKGTYHLGQTPWKNGSGGDIAIVAYGNKLLGGYAAGCASRDIALGNTVLLDNADIIIHGNLTFEGLTFKGRINIDANNIGYPDNFPPYEGSVDLPPGTEVLFRRDAFLGTGSFRIDWGQDDDSGGVLRMVDNVVAGFTGGYCPADFFIVAGGAPDIQLINNTFVDNNGGGVCVDTRYDEGWGSGHPSIHAFNNILYGTSGADLYTDIDTFASLLDNVIGTHDYHGIVSQFGTLTGDPQLDGNYRPIQAPPSPVINSGSNDVIGGLPSSDLDGGPRVVGTAVDRGAYESSLNDAFIQSVTTTDDADPPPAGSLRAAIASVNVNGSGLITFAIPGGCGPHVITLDSELPALTQSAIINGYTQTGTSPNDLDIGDDATLCVILEAGNSNVTHGVQVLNNAGDAVAVSIKGFGFSGFSAAAIDLQGGKGHFVAGNHFGGNIGGHALQPNGIDIRLGIAEHDATIGGDGVGDRNIIGDATGSGIVLQGGSSGALLLGANNNQILNNYIGVGWSIGAGSYTNRGNSARGIHLLGHDNTLSGNLIGHNTQAGIQIDGGGAVSNVIDGNFIGADASYASLGNGNAGIHFTGTTGDAPTGNTVRYNRVTFNGDQGVLVSIGQGNKIRKNSIYANGLLGIDLAAKGVTPNDDDGGVQLNDYANRGQNFPVLTSAAGGYHGGQIGGTLTTTGGDFRLDFYLTPVCDASGHGDGATWLKSATVTVSVPQGLDEGIATFDIPFTTPPLVSLYNGGVITATATDAAGNTSEFSACLNYLNDTIFADGFQPPPA